MALRSHYELLGVAPDADTATIKSAYRRIVKDTHPDRPTGTSGLFGLITDAYDELRDPVARAAYDRRLATGGDGAPDPGTGRAQQWQSAEQEARVAAEQQEARDAARRQAARERMAQRQQERDERQRQDSMAAAAAYIAERKARNPLHLWVLMAAAVFAGFLVSYWVEYLNSPPGFYGDPEHEGVHFGTSIPLMLRAGMLLLFGGFLIARRNQMAPLSRRATAAICVAWALVTAVVHLPTALLLLPVLVFVAVIATGVQAQGKHTGGFAGAAWATAKESVRCGWAAVSAVFSWLLDRFL
jgi:hypothetical protein